MLGHDNSNDRRRVRVVMAGQQQQRWFILRRVMLTILILILVLTNPVAAAVKGELFEILPNQETSEIRSYDGTNNNRRNPIWGSANHPRIRVFPTEYHFLDGGTDIPLDEINSNLPSARRIMEQIFHSTKPHDDKTISHILLEFGHFIVQDILGSRYNTSEPFNIPCDGELRDYVFCPVTGAQATIEERGSIPFHRDKQYHPRPTSPTSTYSIIGNNTGNNSPRATLNGMTSFLDLSNIYGIESSSSSSTAGGGMRHTGGKIALADDGLLSDDYGLMHDDLKAGINTSPGAYSIYIVFIRYHNQIAELYQNKTNGDDDAKTDDEIFEYARRQTIAVYQYFVEEKYLPTLLGNKLDPYSGYDPTVDPSIDEFFAAVAFRYAHSSFSNMIRVLDANYQPTPQDPLLLRDVFKNNVPGLVRKMGGIEPFLRGLTITAAKSIDASLVEDLNLWAEATSVSDVQRGRDVGLPRYNAVREAFGLNRMSSIEELVADRYEQKYKKGDDNDGDDYQNDPDYLYLLQALKELYNDDVDMVDAYVGALVEAPRHPLDNLGPLMALSIQNQFQRLRDGDRYWYKNLYDAEEYEKFPDLSRLIKMVCEGMETFTNDPYIVATTTTPAGSGGIDDGVCSSTGGSTNQLSLLGGDYNVRWNVDQDSSDDKTIEVKLSVQEEMVGPGYLGIGWEQTVMKGAHIWFCTVNENALSEYDPMPSHCAASSSEEDGAAATASSQQPELSMFSCCLALGTNHLRPECAKPGDDLYYSLEVIDWCISAATSSVTVKAPVCGGSDETQNTDESNSSASRNCFRMESSEDGTMDFIVAYNTIDSGRPHGYQRRTNAQVDLTAGILTVSEASTADDGLIATHGAFMLFGWMILAPLGVFIVRYFKTWEKRLVAHISIMGAVGSMMMPLLIGVEASVGATDKTQQHAVVGLIVMSMFFLMAGTGRFRYLKWEGHKIGRKTDFISLLVHKYGGAVFIGLAWWNCYTGLCRIGPEDSEFQLVLFSNLHLGYDIHAFGTVRDYVYGPYVACVVLVFILAEIRLIRLANASRSAMKSGKGLWGDEDDSYLDTMTLETFLDVTRIGNSLCVVDGRVLDITNFIDTHPGGPELLRYVRGSDITEEFVGARDVDGIKHVHSHGALKLMKKFVKAKLIDTDTGQLPRGRGTALPGLTMMKEFLQGQRHMSQPFRRGKVLDVKYVAPSATTDEEVRPVILLQVALPRTMDQLQEKNMTKLPGCSFRFRGIDKDGLMFEREYTAVSLDRHLSKDLSVAAPFGGTSQISLRQLDALVESSGTLIPKVQENNKKDEVYDFVISLIPGGQMSEFFRGLKTGKLLLAQGPKVNAKSVYKVKSEKWKSVVMFAAGTGIASMLQIIDFYLEEQRVIGGHCPMLYLVWVLKSPAHNYHETMNLKGRLRKARGRLRWITVYSASKEGSPEPKMAHSVRSDTAANRRSYGGARTPRRTISAPARTRRAAVVPRFLQSARSQSADDNTDYEDLSTRPSGVRMSMFARARPSAALPLPLPTPRFRMKKTTRMNVRDLIYHVQDQGFNVNDLTFLGEDKRVRLEKDFWIKSPRQMTRHLDRRMLKELLHSMQSFTVDYRKELQEVHDLSDSLTSLRSTEGDIEESTEPTSIAIFLRNNVPIQDRKDGMRLHKECFVASEAIDYLVSFGRASSREHAVSLGRALQEQNLIQHVSVGYAFSDCGEFYRFPPVPEASLATSRVTSNGLPSIGEDEIDLSAALDNGVDPEESDVDHIFGAPNHQWRPSEPVDQELRSSQRPLMDRSEGEMWMNEDIKRVDEEGGRSNLFKGTLVAVSGSPMFEVDIVEMLEGVGVPREQIMTFVATKK